MANPSLSIILPSRWLRKNNHSWPRLLIVASALVLSVVLAQQPTPRYLVLLAGAGITIVFLRRPALGLAALIAASLLVPFDIGTDTGTSLNVTVLLLSLLIGLWLLTMLVQRHEVRLLPSGPILPLIAFSVVSLLAFILGQLPWFAFAQHAPLLAQSGGLAIFLLSAGAFLLVAHQIRDIIWLQRLTWLFLALGALNIAGRFLPEPLRHFIVGLFQIGADGALFWVWLVALAFSQAIFNRRLHLGWRLVLGGVVLATLYFSLFRNRDWASGWLPPLVAVGTILWVGAPKPALLTTAGVGVVMLLNLQKIIGLVTNDELYSWITRVEAARILILIIKVSPILGLGPANYYYYTSLYPIRGWYVQFNSHNNYIDIVAQIGLLGLGCFLWFVWEVGRLGWRIQAQAPEGFAKAYALGALGGLVGLLAAGMLADWVLPFVYNIGLAGLRASVLGWLFLGGLVSLEQIVARDREN